MRKYQQRTKFNEKNIKIFVKSPNKISGEKYQDFRKNSKQNLMRNPSGVSGGVASKFGTQEYRSNKLLRSVGTHLTNYTASNTTEP
jgi:hypothetical protein